MLSPAWVGMAAQRAQQWPGGRPCFGSSFWLSGAFCLCVGHEILRQVLAVPCHSSVQGCTAPPLSPSVHPEGWPCPTSRRMCSLWGSPEIPLQRHEVRNWISCVSQQEKGFDNGLHLLGLLQGVDAVLCRAAPGDDGLLGAAGGCGRSHRAGMWDGWVLPPLSPNRHCTGHSVPQLPMDITTTLYGYNFARYSGRSQSGHSCVHGSRCCS